MKVNPFLRQTVYANGKEGVGPGGDVEDVAWQYAQGVRTWLFCMHHTDFDFRPWKKLIDRIAPFPDAVWLPWAYLWTNEDCWKLRGAAQQAYVQQQSKLRRPAGLWNTEKQWDEGTVTMEALLGSSQDCDVMQSTEPTPYHNIDWSLLPASWILDVQIFVLENEPSTRPRDCRAAFYDAGYRGRVRFQHGVSDDITPAQLPYPERGRYTIYSLDSAGANLSQWMPKTLPPATIPYRGPFYGPSSGRAISRDDQIRSIKRALHNGGYANFSTPDTYWNRKAEVALQRMQVDKGILPATGQFGMRSHEALRRLASAIPGQTNAWTI